MLNTVPKHLLKCSHGSILFRRSKAKSSPKPKVKLAKPKVIYNDEDFAKFLMEEDSRLQNGAARVCLASHSQAPNAVLSFLWTIFPWTIFCRRLLFCAVGVFCVLWFGGIFLCVVVWRAQRAEPAEHDALQP